MFALNSLDPPHTSYIILIRFLFKSSGYWWAVKAKPFQCNVVISCVLCLCNIPVECSKFTARSSNILRRSKWRRKWKSKRDSRYERSRRKWTWKTSRCGDNATLQITTVIESRTCSKGYATTCAVHLHWGSVSSVTGCLLPGPGEEEGGATASAGGDHAYQCWDHASQGAEERGGEAGWHERYGIHPNQTGQMKTISSVDNQQQILLSKQ